MLPLITLLECDSAPAEGPEPWGSTEHGVEVVLAHLEAARTVAHHGGLYHTNAEVKLQGESRDFPPGPPSHTLVLPFPPNAHSCFPSFLPCLPDSFFSSLFFLTHQFNKQLLVAGTRWTYTIQSIVAACFSFSKPQFSHL